MTLNLFFTIRFILRVLLFCTFLQITLLGEHHVMHLNWTELGILTGLRREDVEMCVTEIAQVLLSYFF